MKRSCVGSSVLLILLAATFAARGEETQRAEARAAMLQATRFFSQHVAVQGGYVYRYSEDLKKREGEGVAPPETVWVQPPGTPSVGLAFLDAYARTRDPSLLAAARAAGECLIRGQLRSGGWQDRIDFGDDLRGKLAYRVDPPRKKARDLSTFDDDKTQAALRMMMRLDEALKFEDPRVHECVTYALDAVLRSQFPHGGWAQVFDGTAPDPARHPVIPASYPETWPREYPGGDYWFRYTFNDQAISDTIDALLLAAHIYREPRYRAAALRAGEFILLAQMPAPQPAWAQQYDFEMRPAWARRFEPPAVSGGESQRLLETLMLLYFETGDDKFVKPIPRALDYLERSQLPDGRLARFYELKTNKPLYFTKDYRLTHDDSDLPTHYGFKVGSNVASLRKRLAEIQSLTPEQRTARREARFRRSASRPRDADVRAVIRGLDARGAWVEAGTLRYHGKNDETRRIIQSATFAKNLDLLSRYVASDELR